jgi:hypothetical protein
VILPRGPTSLPLPPPSPTSPTELCLCRDFAQTCGWSGGKGRDASSALGSDEARDGGVETVTRAAIPRGYEFDRGGGGGESGSREGGEGEGEGGVGDGCLSGLPAASPEVQLRQGGPRRQQRQVSETKQGEEEGGGGGRGASGRGGGGEEDGEDEDEGEEEGEAEGDEDRGAAPHGPR